jgi:hypothetical protein
MSADEFISLDLASLKILELTVMLDIPEKIVRLSAGRRRGPMREFDQMHPAANAGKARLPEYSVNLSFPSLNSPAGV